MATEEYHALWRSSAHEAVPYTDDFPEALLVLPELCDGSIGQGNATRLTIQIHMNGDNSKLTVTDNGGGIRNERRLLAWAASKATSNIHRNGHGTKKCLTKWEPNYEKADWTIRWRLPGKNLQTTKGPFRGYSPDSIIDDEGNDAHTLMPSGCEISIYFNASSVLGDLSNNPDGLYTAVREILQTRYSEETFIKTEFIIEISHPSKKKLLPRSSKKEKWHSFKTSVLNHIKSNVVKKLHESKHDIEGGYYIIEIYFIDINGNMQFALKREFPKYGLKSMRSSRVHISLDGRVIEAIPIYQLLGREANHNDLNGYKVFVNFVPDTKDDFAKLPVPCTTKVSLYENDPVYRLFVQKFKEVFGPIESKNRKENEKNKVVVITESLPITVKQKTTDSPVAAVSAPPVADVAAVAPPVAAVSTQVARVDPTPIALPVAAVSTPPVAPPVPVALPVAPPVVPVAPPVVPVALPVAPPVVPVAPPVVPVAPPVVAVAPPDVAVPAVVAVSTPVTVAPPAVPVQLTHTPSAVVTPALSSSSILSLSVTQVGGHNRLVGCSRQNLFEFLIHFKEKIINLDMQALKESAPSTTELGLAQKIQILREILESI
jgi:hypothetical protein